MLFKRAYSARLSINMLLVTAALVYVLIMCFLLFFQGRHMMDGYMYNMVPFKTIKGYIVNYHHYNFNIWFKNLFGNIVLFIPMGIFLPLLNWRFSRVWLLAVSTIVLIFIVELVQMLSRVGSFDVDDIILNTFGALLGLIMTRIAVYVTSASGNSNSFISSGK